METRPSNRSFGLVFAGVFFLLAAYFYFAQGKILTWSLALSGAFVFFSFFFSEVLTLPNTLWTKFGLLLHKIVSPLVLAILFFLVVTPIGLIMRILKRDLLQLKIDKQLPTYWSERTPPGPPPESLKNLF